MMSGRTGSDLVVLAGILALAAVLRAVGLNWSLWYDEVLTLQTHVGLDWSQMMTSYSMNHHYLHNLAVKAAVALFGEANWVVRLPALLFGLGGIAAMWGLARWIAGASLAHLTALLLALSYHHIWFSQNARGYTGLALFSTLGLWFFLRGLKSGRMTAWFAFAACMAATIFTHLTGAFFFLTLGLVWLGLVAVRARGDEPVGPIVVPPLLGFLLGGVVTLALYAPVFPSLLETMSQVAGTSAADPMQEYQNPLWAAYEGLRTGLGQAGWPVLAVGAITLALSVIGALSLRGREPLFGVVTFGSILLTIVVLLAVGMRIWPRFFFVDIPLVLFLIVLGVHAVCDWIARRLPATGRWLFPAAAVAMVAVSGALALRAYSAPKQDLAGAVALVEGERQSGERVYAVSYSGEAFTGHYGTDWGTIWTADDIRAALAQPGPLTIVVPFPDRNLREYPDLAAARDSGALAERAWLPGTLGDGYILILRRAGP